MSHVHYLPLTPGLFSILVFVAAGLIILIQLRILRYAYLRLGVSPAFAMLLLIGSLIGSYFNLPVATLPKGPVVTQEVIQYFGMRYIVPVIIQPATIVAVNVGGAVIPTVMSLYLAMRYQLWLTAAFATAIV